MLDLLAKLAMPLLGLIGTCSFGLALCLVLDQPRPRRAPPPAPAKYPYRQFGIPGVDTGRHPRRIRVVPSPSIVRYDVVSHVGDALVYDRSLRALAAELKMEPDEMAESIRWGWQDLSFTWRRLDEAGVRRGVSTN